MTTRSTSFDAEVLDGAGNAADESDTSGWKPLTSVGYSYRGDYVCHAGARSASLGHATPCGIKVTTDDLYFHEGGHTVRGVEGVDVHGWGSVNGDSGGTVLAVEPHGNRELRGWCRPGVRTGPATSGASTGPRRSTSDVGVAAGGVLPEVRLEAQPPDLSVGLRVAGTLSQRGQDGGRTGADRERDVLSVARNRPQIAPTVFRVGGASLRVSA